MTVVIFAGCSFCTADMITEDLQSKLKSGPLRTDVHTREVAERVQLIEDSNLPRITAKNLERETGVRYSILNMLHYHKPISNHVVEPLHNLLLGNYIINITSSFLLHQLIYLTQE